MNYEERPKHYSGSMTGREGGRLGTKNMSSTFSDEQRVLPVQIAHKYENFTKVRSMSRRRVRATTGK